MSTIFVFVASPTEQWSVARLLEPRSRQRVVPTVTRGQIGVNHILLFRTGVGPGPARLSAERAFETIWDRKLKVPLSAGGLPNAVLVTGLCGGLSANLAARDIVLYSACITSDCSQPHQICSSALIRQLANGLSYRSIPFRSVVGLTLARLAVTPEEKQSLQRLGADVVDMESYYVAAVASSKGAPVAVLRAVADAADQPIPDVTSAVRPDGMMSLPRVMSRAALSPLESGRWLLDSVEGLSSLRKTLACVLGRNLEA